MYVGCLLVPRFPLAVELAARPQLVGRPVAVAHPHRPEVVAASPEAECWGIAVGQSLSEAIGRCPEIEILDARPARYAALAEALATAIERVAPGTEPAAEGLYYVDLRGLAPLHGGDAGLHRALLAALPAVLHAQLGVGGSRFVSLMAAHAAPAGQTLVVSVAETASFLGRQSVEVLDAEPEVVRRLERLGLRHLADVAVLPPGLLAAQFGAAGERLWRCARGEDDEPVRPRSWQEEVIETLDLESPLTTSEPLCVAVFHLLTRALGHDGFSGRAARQLRLSLLTEHDQQWQRTLTFREALADGARIADVLRPVLMEAQLPGPVVRIVLELHELVMARVWQVPLLSREGAHRVELEEGLRKLRARYGHCPVERIVEVEPWNRIPERRRALTSFPHP